MEALNHVWGYGSLGVSEWKSQLVFHTHTPIPPHSHAFILYAINTGDGT